MTANRKTAAIAASDLTAGQTLIGDSICPTRYGRGIKVQVVNVEDGLVMVIAGGERIEFNANETVYIAR